MVISVGTELIFGEELTCRVEPVEEFVTDVNDVVS